MTEDPKLVYRNTPHPERCKTSISAWLCHIFFCAPGIDRKRSTGIHGLDAAINQSNLDLSCIYYSSLACRPEQLVDINAVACLKQPPT